ncbi:insulinase family protein [Miniimonas arenae]|uniref:Insulinase family protein n=1 Tax=Miniimonas arenae TaxID=676201 RepID=A0A5C5BG80_9MICO|nr:MULTISPECIES: pitrilysin family protein [Miniimonas]TNU77290.1 insulinase family protein [Miniimonas arenae]
MPLPLGSTEELDLTLQDGSRLRRTVLEGGVRVLSETIPATRSVSISATVAVGSRDERDGHHGSTHFLEHLLFKGTHRRDALDIAAAFDAVGGEANAVTGKESTSYYARVLQADQAMATDVLLDMVTSATLDVEDVELERGVILEELAMADDDPNDVAHEAFAAAVLAGHPLGRPIGGTPETIRAVPRDAVWDHYRRTYTPAELVVTAAGAVDHDALCAMVRQGALDGGWELARGARPAPRRTEQPPAEAPGTALTVHRSTEQATVVLGGRAIAADDERRFALSVLNAVLGGGMSSRLFQEIREKRGLAYSVYSFATSYTEAGYFGLAAGCQPARVAEVATLMAQEWRSLATDGVTPEELDRAIGQLVGSLVLGLEDTGSRMSRLSRAEVTLGQWWDVDETLAAIRAVTAEDVRALAVDLLARPRSLVVVGPATHDVAGEVLASLA